MRDLRLMIGAGQVEEVAAVGAYLRIKSASVPLLIEIEGGKSRFEIAKGGSANLMPFQRFSVSHSSGTDQAVVIAVGEDGEEQTEGVMTGEVAIPGGVIINNPVVYTNVTHTQRTVTNTSSAIAPNRPTRSFLIIQNRSFVGSIYVKFVTSATVADGIRIAPGEKLEFLAGVVPNGLIYAIGDLASNSDVLVVEGI